MIDFNAVEMAENLRTLTLDNGNKIHFKRKDPYGFWTVNYDKGQVPKHLQGLYTSYDRALADVTVYLRSLPKEKEAEVEVERPKIKYKPKKEAVEAA